LRFLIPLCVGGQRGDSPNLWPQPVAGKRTAAAKDQLESSVCREDIALEQARDAEPLIRSHGHFSFGLKF